MLRHIITIAKRKDDGNKTFGKSGQPTYEILGDFHAAEDFNRGTKALREEYRQLEQANLALVNPTHIYTR